MERQLSLLLCLFVLPVQQAFSQQGNPIIDWLTSVQALESRLRSNGGDASVAAELRLLQREIAENPHSAAHYGVYAFKPKMPLSLAPRRIPR